MAEAVTQVHPEVSETLGALVPSSNRKALNSSNTFKNCAGALRLPYRPEQMGGLDFAGRCQLARRLLREANSPDTARFIANNMGGAVRKVGQAMHSYQEKLQVLNFTKTANNDTFMLDYVGGLRSTGFEDQVSSVRYRATNLDPGFRTVTLYLTTSGLLRHRAGARLRERHVRGCPGGPAAPAGHLLHAGGGAVLRHAREWPDQGHRPDVAAGNGAKRNDGHGRPAAGRRRR